MTIKPFVLHTSPLDVEGCPTDRTSPVPPPWDSPPGAGGGQASAGPGPSGAGSLARVTELGQMFAKYSRSPEVRPFEEVFRSEPNEAWFDPARDPEHPTQFEIGTVRPGRGTSHVIMDYSVRPYGFSGLTPNDYDGLDDDRISGSFGYSLTINGQAPGILRYFLDPIASTVRQQAFGFNRSKTSIGDLTADDFVRSQASEYASAAGYGTSLHPQTADRFGGRIIPFGEFLHDDMVMAVTGVVFRAIEVPLAFVQVRFSGFTCSSELAHKVERALRTSMR